MEPADIMLLIIGFFSEVIGTMAGFGSSTIYLPLASYFVDFRTALVTKIPTVQGKAERA